jgi:hypothetical protein
MKTRNAQAYLNHDLEVEGNIIEVNYAPRGLRGIERALMNLASSLAGRQHKSGYLVVINPLVTERRLKEEWVQALEPLREDIKENLHLVIAKGDRILGIPTNIDEALRRKVEDLARQHVPARGTRLLPKDNYYEILKILIYRWLNNCGPSTAKAIAAAAGCTYPTLSKATARLGILIKRGPKRSIELSHFPKEEWSKLVSHSERIRSTMWFVDRSGQPRSIDSLLSRVRKIQLPNVAVGGIYGTKHHYLELDLIGNPSLVLSVHCEGSEADITFVRDLDPALQRSPSPIEPPNLILHFIRRSKAYFSVDSTGLNITDPVECLLDLHEARLESQALGFLNHLMTERQGKSIG